MAGTYEQAKVGDPNSSAGPKWVAQFLGMNEKLNSSNLLEDTGIASPNNLVFRTLLAAGGFVSREAAAGTHWCAPSIGGEGGVQGSPSGNEGVFVVPGSGGGVSNVA